MVGQIDFCNNTKSYNNSAISNPVITTASISETMAKGASFATVSILHTNEAI